MQFNFAGRWIAIACLLAACSPVRAELPVVAPSEVGLSAERLDAIRDVVERGIEQKQMPGCVVLIGRHGKIAYCEAFGNRRVQPSPEPMTHDTLFDLASLTKPIATATSVMILVDRGKIDVDKPVGEYLPEFADAAKRGITVRQLLAHQSGLTPDNSLADYKDGPEVAWQKICELKLLSPPGDKFRYSDVGFIVLGKLVERVSGKPLNEFVRDEIFDPLKMHETGYLPDEELRRRAAPTEQRGGDWIVGEVHDPRAFYLGGVAGHAGLFSTAGDLASYASAMANRGRLGDVQILSDAAWTKMTESVDVGGGVRTLGWDRRTGYSINRPHGMSDRAFGHGGFTGTVLWIDPATELFVIFLSNRVHPDGSGSVNRLAGEIGGIAVDAIQLDDE